MAPSEYSFRLEKGIAGFAQYKSDAVYTVTRARDHSNLTITCAERPTGTPSLQEFAPKNRPLADIEALVDELHGILKKLPLEDPPGSEDIYGLSTGIAWGSDDLLWCNGGSGGGTSSKQATAEEKEQFKRAVEIIEQIVKG